jgi:transcriptional regulator with XRE-family HTH domain
MNLRDYLSAETISLTEFAARLGVPITTAHGYVSGRRMPPLDAAVRIEELTGGAVTVRDLLASQQPAA